MVSLETEFSISNHKLLFDKYKHQEGEYVATYNDKYSAFHDENYYSLEWNRQFPGGRYVIFVYERCAVFLNGKLYYQNNDIHKF